MLCMRQKTPRPLEGAPRLDRNQAAGLERVPIPNHGCRPSGRWRPRPAVMGPLSVRAEQGEEKISLVVPRTLHVDVEPSAREYGVVHVSTALFLSGIGARAPAGRVFFVSFGRRFVDPLARGPKTSRPCSTNRRGVPVGVSAPRGIDDVIRTPPVLPLLPLGAGRCRRLAARAAARPLPLAAARAPNTDHAPAPPVRPHQRPPVGARRFAKSGRARARGPGPLPGSHAVWPQWAPGEDAGVLDLRAGHRAISARMIPAAVPTPLVS
jgi:hypothetical protein